MLFADLYSLLICRLAFATYLLSIMLFICNIRRGGYFMFLCGVMQLLAALTYGVVSQNDPPLRVYFADNVLRPTFNYAFYLTLFTGLLTVVLAGVVVVMDIFYPRKIATFFHHALTEDDVIFEVSTGRRIPRTCFLKLHGQSNHDEKPAPCQFNPHLQYVHAGFSLHFFFFFLTNQCRLSLQF